MLRKICTVFALAFALALTAATGFAQDLGPGACRLGSTGSIVMEGAPDRLVDCYGEEAQLCAAFEWLIDINDGAAVTVEDVDAACVSEPSRGYCSLLRDFFAAAAKTSDFYRHARGAGMRAARVAEFGEGGESLCWDCPGFCYDPKCCCWGETPEECGVDFFCPPDDWQIYDCDCYQGHWYCGYEQPFPGALCQVKCEWCGY